MFFAVITIYPDSKNLCSNIFLSKKSLSWNNIYFLVCYYIKKSTTISRINHSTLTYAQEIIATNTFYFINNWKSIWILDTFYFQRIIPVNSYFLHRSFIKVFGDGFKNILIVLTSKVLIEVIENYIVVSP